MFCISSFVCEKVSLSGHFSHEKYIGIIFCTFKICYFICSISLRFMMSLPLLYFILYVVSYQSDLKGYVTRKGGKYY